jgi:hypothetical protein
LLTKEAFSDLDVKFKTIDTYVADGKLDDAIIMADNVKRSIGVIQSTAGRAGTAIGTGGGIVGGFCVAGFIGAVVGGIVTHVASKVLLEKALYVAGTIEDIAELASGIKRELNEIKDLQRVKKAGLEPVQIPHFRSAYDRYIKIKTKIE